jgi:hypothetical protein
VRDWQPDPEVTRANITNQLSGPALAVPDRGALTSADDVDADATDTDTATTATPSDRPRSTAAPSRSSGSSDEVILDDRVLNPPSSFPPVPYPNPTSTPPDAIAPPDATPQTPAPALDPDNPYREP